MSKPVPFAALDNLLRRLGFAETAVPGSHVRYEHTPSGTVLVLRAHRPGELASWSDTTVVRRFLVEKGLIEGDAFERLLQEEAA